MQPVLPDECGGWQLFDLSYTPKWGLYSDSVEFIDPLNKFSGVEGYLSTLNTETYTLSPKPRAPNPKP